MEKLRFNTKRIILRPYELEDYLAWVEGYSGFTKKLNPWDIEPRSASILTKKAFRKLLSAQKVQRKTGNNFDFAAFEKNTGRLVGTVALMDITRGVFQNAYLGYRVLNPFWHQGFGKELVEAILRFGFHGLNLHRIEAGIDPYNRRSLFLARSLGMRKEGLKKRALYLEGEWRDIVMYALTCEDVGIRFKGDLKEMSFRLR